jgi:hypothetical protein
MSGRRLSAALAIGVGLALAIDLLLRVALDAVRIQPSTVPWEAAIASKAVWLVAIALGGVCSPWLLSVAQLPMPWRDASHMASVVLMATPLLWTAATLIILAANVPWTQPSFYAELMTSVAPWVLAGVGLRAVARHIPH